MVKLFHQKKVMSFENSKKQVENKKGKFARFMKFCAPRKRKFGKSVYACRRCGKTSGVIVKYGLRYCRQCFREEAPKLGFRKYN